MCSMTDLQVHINDMQAPDWFRWSGGQAFFAYGRKHNGEALAEVAASDPGYLVCSNKLITVWWSRRMLIYR